MSTQKITMKCQHKKSQCNVNTKNHNAMSTQNITMQCQHKTLQRNVNTKHHNEMSTQKITMKCQHKKSQCNVNTKHHNEMSTQNITIQCQHKTTQYNVNIYFNEKLLRLFIKSFKHHVFYAWRWLLRPQHVACAEWTKIICATNGKTYVCVVTLIGDCGKQIDCHLRCWRWGLSGCNTESSRDAWFGVRG
jgi:hypothetical protein